MAIIGMHTLIYSKKAEETRRAATRIGNRQDTLIFRR